MTPTEVGRRIDELYFDTTDLKRMGLCRMVANREADLDAARAESEELVVRLNAEHLARQNAEAERDRLRELVRDMWREGAFEPGACYEKAVDRLEERTRELGVEVDG